jgi:oxygen-dependent protoporphyrinogen oxidase
VIVIGGGISGLATCYFLGQRGIPSTLVEKSGRLGGLIKTDQVDGCELEAGPDGFIAAKTSVAALAAELGISDRIIGSNDSARRIFIRRHGKLTPMPKGMAMMVPGDLRAALNSPLFGARTKLRLLTEQWTSPRERPGDVSIEQFIIDHFGRDLLEGVAEPLLSGVYGGDAARMSTAGVLPRFLEYERKYGSLVKAVRAEHKPGEGSAFLSFAGGMQVLTDTLSNAIRPQTEVCFESAHAVSRTDDGWRVELDSGVLQASHVVLTCPAYASAQLLNGVSPTLTANLEAIPYSSAILVMLVYDREQLGHPLDGFGILIPRTERRHIVATTWVSTKFPSRTPGNRAALRAFVVGDEALRLMQEPDAVLVNLIGEEIRDLMKISAPPLLSTVHRWPQSMPQYMVGHQVICETIEKASSELPGLHICGNAYQGVGIPDCVRMARQVAGRINLNPVNPS